MIFGIGIDIVHVDRIERWMREPDLVKRFFNPREIEASASRGSSAALSLAARFAAKEAFGKALGTGLTRMRLVDIFVANDHNGKPELFLEGSAKERFESMGGGKIHVSLTHEGVNAVAIVIIEKDS